VYSGPIILDAPGWGQETTTLLNAVQGTGTGGVKINDTNIVLSLHVYPGAWNQSAGGHYLNTSDVTSLSAAGRPLLVGEFGYGGTGSCDVTAVTNAVHTLGYSVLGWCWNGDGTGMNMMSPAWSSAAWPSPRSSIAKTSYWTTIYNMLW